MNPATAFPNGVIVFPIEVAPRLARSMALLIRNQREQNVPLDPVDLALFDHLRSASSAIGSAEVPTRNATPLDTAEWIPVRDAARLVGITERAIRKAISAKRVQAQMFGRGYLVNPKSLEEVYGK